MKTNEKLLAHMRQATRAMMSQSGNATRVIQNALRGLQAKGHAAPPTPAPDAQAQVAQLLAGLGIDNPLARGPLGQPPAGPAPGAPADVGTPGHFIDGSFTNAAGTRAYKLYVPAAYTGQSLPLVVMLHGCTQNPDDFARGTQMNHLAEENHCLVLYPAQSQQANQSRCWNWFSALDQKRGQGEPSIIAGMTAKVVADYAIKPDAVYVAGLSAGGAMAVIMGTLYPDLYAAVGVHSGLPYASAHDLPSALAAMQGKARGRAQAGGERPIIVFHGDRDTTVHPVNGEQVIAQSTPTGAQSVQAEAGQRHQGHAYTRTVHRRADGAEVAEHWLVHGAGHAWSGGSAHGSYTDARGPDASREMLRFFRTAR